MNTTTTTTKLDEYYDALTKLAEEKSEQLFGNSSQQHALAVITTVFRYAENSIRIFDKNLTGDISEDNRSFFKAIDNFLGAGKKLKMLISDKHDSKNPPSAIYNHLKGLTENKQLSQFLDIRQADDKGDYKAFLYKKFKDEVGFTVADSRMFRIETNPNIREAVCSFNKPDVSVELEKVFDAAFDVCPKYLFTA